MRAALFYAPPGIHINADQIGYNGGSIADVLNTLGKNFYRATQGGAVPNSATDQTAKLQAAVNAANANGSTFIVDGIFYAMPQDYNYGDGVIRKVCLQIPSNTKVVFLPGSEIRILPNNFGTHYGICTYLSDNVEIWNPVVRGERNNHLDGVGESGNCFNIVNCTNVYVHRPIAFDAWGDGVYVGNEFYAGTNKVSKNVTIFEPQVYNARRNGISVTGGINLYVVRPYCENINGTWPQSGMDLEPEGQGATAPVVENWRIIEPRTKNCVGAGINVYTNAIPANGVADIHVSDHKDYGSGSGAVFQHGATVVTGQVVFTNPFWENNQNNGLVSKTVVNGPRFVADNFTVKNCGNRVPMDWVYASALGIYRQAGEGTTQPGNFVYRGRVVDTNSIGNKKIPFAAFISDDGTAPVNSLQLTSAIIDIIENSSLYVGRGKFNQGVDSTCSISLGGQGGFAGNITRGFTAANEMFTDAAMLDSAAANVTITLDNNARQPLHAIKLARNNYSFVVQAPAGSQIFPTTAVSGKGIYSNDPGASVKLFPVGASDWVAQVISGNWVST